MTSYVLRPNPRAVSGSWLTVNIRRSRTNVETRQRLLWNQTRTLPKMVAARLHFWYQELSRVLRRTRKFANTAGVLALAGCAGG